jgi:hypothetical protein
MLCLCVCACLYRANIWVIWCVCVRERETESEWVSKIERKYSENREKNFIFQNCVILAAATIYHTATTPIREATTAPNISSASHSAPGFPPVSIL